MSSSFDAYVPNGLSLGLALTHERSTANFFNAGSLIGSLASGRLCDSTGRCLNIAVSTYFTCIGTVIDISPPSPDQPSAYSRRTPKFVLLESILLRVSDMP